MEHALLATGEASEPSVLLVVGYNVRNWPRLKMLFTSRANSEDHWPVYMVRVEL